MVNKVDLSKPDITKDEISNVIEVLESGWLAPGKYNNLFEVSFKN